LVFFTKALYEQIRGLVGDCFRGMTGEAPDHDKCEVLHAWGGRRQPGFYHDLAVACGQTPLTVDAARRRFGSSSPAVQFEAICDELDRAVAGPLGLYDAILIDEGQDLPPAFYRLALKALREPRRLYWAYDEAQGIGSLLVPRPAAVFGEAEGRPLVDLSGKYDGASTRATSSAAATARRSCC
jgi:superfamily I DNA and RNA helicase